MGVLFFDIIIVFIFVFCLFVLLWFVWVAAPIIVRKETGRFLIEGGTYVTDGAAIYAYSVIPASEFRKCRS